jgi:hypothetical protein
LAKQAQPPDQTLDVPKLGIKRQVFLGAQASAQVIRTSNAD